MKPIREKIDKLVQSTTLLLLNKLKELSVCALVNQTIFDNYLHHWSLLSTSPEDCINLFNALISNKLESSNRILIKKYIGCKEIDLLINVVDSITKMFTSFLIFFPQNKETFCNLLVPKTVEFIDTYRDKLQCLTVTSGNVEKLIANFEQLFLRFNTLNTTLRYRLAQSLFYFGNSLKNILVTKALQSCVENFIIGFEKEDAKLMILYQNESCENLAKVVKESLFDFLVQTEIQLDFFINMFTALSKNDGKSSPFFQIFDHLFELTIYSNFLFEFFEKIHPELHIIAGHQRASECPETNIHIFVLCESVSRCFIQRFHAKHDPYNHHNSPKHTKEISELYISSSQKYLASFVRKYAEKHFVVPVLGFINSQLTETTLSVSVNNFPSAITKFVDVISQFKRLSPLQHPTNKITFKFVSSSPQGESGSFDTHSSIAKSFDDSFDESLPGMISLMYKIVAKTIVEGLKLDFYQNDAILQIQKLAFLIKKVFSGFIELNKKYEAFEFEMFNSLQIQHSDASLLLSYDELESK